MTRGRPRISNLEGTPRPSPKDFATDHEYRRMYQRWRRVNPEMMGSGYYKSRPKPKSYDTKKENPFALPKYTPEENAEMERRCCYFMTHHDPDDGVLDRSMYFVRR